MTTPGATVSARPTVPTSSDIPPGFDVPQPGNNEMEKQKTTAPRARRRILEPFIMTRVTGKQRASDLARFIGGLPMTHHRFSVRSYDFRTAPAGYPRLRRSQITRGALALAWRSSQRASSGLRRRPAGIGGNEQMSPLYLSSSARG